jgi:hypothetical protein
MIHNSEHSFSNKKASTINMNAVSILLLAAGAAGHMIMKSPPTYNPATVVTSPLSIDAGGPVPFPCQMGPSADYTSSNATMVKAGNSVPLHFTGSAVHGGGSCQISLFPLVGGKTPSGDPSEWKVIHSIIGGCPATTAGNLEGDGAPSDAYGRPDSYECTSAKTTDCKKFYSIPTDPNLPSGDYVWAWTWFNHIGNQEMYMNCAPITVTGGSSNRDYLDSLPSIFAANLPGTCKVYDGERIIDFPNPGASVERSPFPQDAAPSPANAIGTCSSASTGGSPASGSNSAPPSGSSSAPAPGSISASAPSASSVPVPGASSSDPGTSVTASSSASAPDSGSNSQSTSISSSPIVSNSPSYSNNGNLSVSVPAPAASPSSDSPLVIVPVGPDGLLPTPATPSTAAPSTSSAPADAAPAVGSGCANPCDTEGAVVCFPPNGFGLCDHGCAVVQPLAAGTSCSNGVIVKRTVPCENCRFRPRNHTRHIHHTHTKLSY